MRLTVNVAETFVRGMTRAIPRNIQDLTRGALNNLSVRGKILLSNNRATLAGAAGAMYIRPNIGTLMGERAVELTRKASSITDLAFERVKENLRPGMTELQIAAIFDRAVKKFGGAGLSFDTLVRTGSNAALVFSRTMAHLGPTDRVIKRGDLVLIDAGAMVEFSKKTGGIYVGADVSRTFAIGKPEFFKITLYNTVEASLLASQKVIKDGARFGDVDNSARWIIDNAGLHNFTFWHLIGHGMAAAGQNDIHAIPLIRTFGVGTLAEGQIITSEPGIYAGLEMDNGEIKEVPISSKYWRGTRQWAGGIRIENTILVTKNGCEVLTKFPTDLESNTVPYGTDDGYLGL